MAFTLDRVVPWGRSFDEYVAMFALTEADLQDRILGCGDGPAAFNCTLTQRGGRVVSLDPLYQFSTTEIRDRIRDTFDDILQKVSDNAQDFVWDAIASPEQLGQVRQAAMDEFLADYAVGKAAGRYLPHALPTLPFGDRSFDLALCSHFLLLYSAQLDLAFHIASLLEMAQVASEVRIFPVVELGNARSRHLNPLIATLRDRGYTVEIVPVAYEFQRGGHEMLRLTQPLLP